MSPELLFFQWFLLAALVSAVAVLWIQCHLLLRMVEVLHCRLETIESEDHEPQ